MTTTLSPLRALIRVLWDQGESVWVATSEDVPGLVVEAASFDEIVVQVRALVPELLSLNGFPDIGLLDLHFLADRLESVAA